MKTKTKNLFKGVQLRNDAGAPATIPFAPGMSVRNANGDLDAVGLGFQYTIQTTTLIRARVIEQKFYRVAPADFMTVNSGQGAWLDEIKTNLQYDAAGDFDAGIMGMGSNNAEVPQVEVGTAPATAKIATWMYGYQYNLIEVQKALAANNWDVVEGKHSAVKRKWDLGIQKVAFLGLLRDLTGFPGLLTNSQVNIDTATIPQNISAMDPDEFSTFVSAIIAAFAENCDYTVMPNTFVIPTSDAVGLAGPVSPTFPVGPSKMEYLVKAFKEVTGDPSFKVLSLAYSNKAKNDGYTASGGKDRYVLYNNNNETLSMDLPVDFNFFAPGTADNFTFRGVSAGQFTGCIVYRPKEMLYFDHT